MIFDFERATVVEDGFYIFHICTKVLQSLQFTHCELLPTVLCGFHVAGPATPGTCSAPRGAGYKTLHPAPASQSSLNHRQTTAAQEPVSPLGPPPELWGPGMG